MKCRLLYSVSELEQMSSYPMTVTITQRATPAMGKQSDRLGCFPLEIQPVYKKKKLEIQTSFSSLAKLILFHILAAAVEWVYMPIN